MMKKTTLALVLVTCMGLLITTVSAQNNEQHTDDCGRHPEFSGEMKGFSGNRKMFSGDMKPFSGDFKGRKCEKQWSGDHKPFSGDMKQFSGEKKGILRNITSSTIPEDTSATYTAPNGKIYTIMYTKEKWYTSSNFKTVKYFKNQTLLKAYITKNNKK